MWRHVTIIAKFLDHKNMEFKQQQQRRQQEQLEISNKFILAKQQPCMYHAFLYIS